MSETSAETMPGSAKAKALLADCANASFACGEWESDEDVPYESVLRASHDAERKLLEYIAELEAKAK